MAHSTVAQFIRMTVERAGSQLVSVTFAKNDGSERQLTFNPKHVGEIKGTGTKCKDENVFRVMDININQWRSFRAERVLQIKVNGEITKFN